MKIDICILLENLSIKFQFNSNLTIITRTLREDRNKISIISGSVLLRTKYVSDKNCRESRKTHFRFNKFYFNRTVYEIKWKNIVERGRPQMAIWRMLIACWMLKATNTRAVCVIIIAFPLQQWLYKRVSILYVHCLMFLIDNVLILSPVGNDYWLRYVCLSTCISKTHEGFMCAEFKSSYCLLRMSSPVLWPRGHSLFMQFLVSPYADILRTPGTSGWEPASTVYQTLGTS